MDTPNFNLIPPDAIEYTATIKPEKHYTTTLRAQGYHYTIDMIALKVEHRQIRTGEGTGQKVKRGAVFMTSFGHSQAGAIDHSKSDKEPGQWTPARLKRHWKMSSEKMGTSREVFYKRKFSNGKSVPVLFFFLLQF